MCVCVAVPSAEQSQVSCLKISLVISPQVAYLHRISYLQRDFPALMDPQGISVRKGGLVLSHKGTAIKRLGEVYKLVTE